MIRRMGWRFALVVPLGFHLGDALKARSSRPNDTTHPTGGAAHIDSRYCWRGQCQGWGTNQHLLEPTLLGHDNILCRRHVFPISNRVPRRRPCTSRMATRIFSGKWGLFFFYFFLLEGEGTGLAGTDLWSGAEIPTHIWTLRASTCCV